MSSETQRQQQSQPDNPAHESRTTIVNIPKGHPTWPQYNGITSAAVGGIQVALSVASVFMNVVGYFNYAEFYVATPGIGCLAFLLTSGGLAIDAARKKTTRLIVATFVVSILAAVSCLAVVAMAAVIIAKTTSEEFWLTGEINLVLGTPLLVWSILGVIPSVILSVISGIVVCGKKSQPQAVSSTRIIYES